MKKCHFLFVFIVFHAFLCFFHFYSLDNFRVKHYNQNMYENRKHELIYLEERIYANEFLHVAMLGITKPNPDYFICHSAKIGTLWKRYNFEYVLSGKGRIETPEGIYTVEAGDFFFLNKEREHIYYADKEDPFEKVFIAVEGALVDHLTAFHKLTDSVVVKRVDVRPIFERLLALVEKHPSPYFLSENYPEICKVLAELCQSLSPADFSKVSPESPPTAVMQEYINKNIYTKLRVEDIATEAHLSTSYAEKIFKEAYGMSITRYVLDRKLHLARHLLIYTYMNVETVALKLSFSNAKHFTKMFKQKYGLSPTKYCKEFHKNQAKNAE